MHNLAVDVDFTELVLDDDDFLAVVLRQDVVEQGGLPTPKESSQNGDWNPLVFDRGVRFVLLSLLLLLLLVLSRQRSKRQSRTQTRPSSVDDVGVGPADNCPRF